MDRKAFVELHGSFCDKLKTITAAKNADYTGGGDPFANFKTAEIMNFGVTTEQSFMTRMVDKFTRISTFVKGGVLKVKDESVEDTLLDLANYSILLACYIKSKRQEQGTITAQQLNS